MNNKGITLLEVLLIISLFVVLIYGSATLSANKTTRKDLTAKTLAVIDIIGQARQRSITGLHADVWGIAVLDNDASCTDSGDCLVMFKGDSYASRNTSYDQYLQLDSGVYLESTEEKEFYFKPFSGWLATTTDKSIDLKSNHGEQKTVTTTLAGVIYYGD